MSKPSYVLNLLHFSLLVTSVFSTMGSIWGLGEAVCESVGTCAGARAAKNIPEDVQPLARQISPVFEKKGFASGGYKYADALNLDDSKAYANLVSTLPGG